MHEPPRNASWTSTQSSQVMTRSTVAGLTERPTTSCPTSGCIGLAAVGFAETRHHSPCRLADRQHPAGSPVKPGRCQHDPASTTTPTWARLPGVLGTRPHTPTTFAKSYRIMIFL